MASGLTPVQEWAVWEPSPLLQMGGNAMGKVPSHGFEYLKDILLPAVSLMPAGVCVMEFSGAPDACLRSPEAFSPTQRLMPTCGLETAEGRAVGPPVPEVLKDSGHVPGGDVPFSPLQPQTAEETLPSRAQQSFPTRRRSGSVCDGPGRREPRRPPGCPAGQGQLCARSPCAARVAHYLEPVASGLGRGPSRLPAGGWFGNSAACSQVFSQHHLGQREPRGRGSAVDLVGNQDPHP